MKYLLDAPHFTLNQYFPAGTIVGDGTPYPWKDASGNYAAPSLGVTALDAAAKAAIATRYVVNTAGTKPLKKR